MGSRLGTIKRTTKETDIRLEFELDGKGDAQVQTGIAFFDHMLDLFTKHGGFSLSLKVKGDIEVDYHHTVEDVGICLGQAFRQALGDGAGMKRYASGLIPMDEALCQLAIDVSNRPFLQFDVDLPKTKVGTFDVELLEEFMRAFVSHAKVTLHIKMLSGTNLHHILEACFKGLGIILSQAVAIDPKRRDQIPSTKGML